MKITRVGVDIAKHTQRWLHQAYVIQIRGESYRLRQARHSGLIGGKKTN